jgi:transposase
MVAICLGCYKKQVRINELEEENARLRAKLRYQERTAAEGPFKSGTPSSKVPVKANSLAERQAKKGGGQAGHRGHGRSSVSAGQADREEILAAPEVCPACEVATESKGYHDRTVTDYEAGRLERGRYRVESRRCPRCGKLYTAKPAGVFPRSEYGNGLLTQVAVEHYVHGRTLGQLEQQLEIGYGGLMQAMHQLAKRLGSVPERLIGEYRQSPVKHADETGWRTDGQNGYAWGFFTETLSLFRFRQSRSSAVAREVFGEKKLPGVLVVDRYGAYNRLRCAIQYCYAHLLRLVQDTEKEFPDSPEVRTFVAGLAPLLALAMGLRGLKLSRRVYRQRAAEIKKQIQRVVHAPARHPAVQRIQDIFRQHANRMYHWAKDPSIPADNNRAERELRPLVIARKVSFGSQSDRGARTREVLMTVLHTLRKRTADVGVAFKTALDRLAADPTLDPYPVLFPPDTS